MNVFKLIKQLYLPKSKQHKLQKLFTVAGLATTTLLLSKASALAEGSYQLELRDETNALPTNTSYSQGLLEYDSSYQSDASGVPLRDRPLYVDVLNNGEVINISACGQVRTDNLQVQLYYHPPGTFDEYTSTPPTGTLVFDTGTLSDGNVACNDPFNKRINNPLVRYNTNTSAGGSGTGTYEVRLYNLDKNGSNGVLDRFDVTITPNTTTNPDPRENQGRLWSYVWGFRSGSFDSTHAVDTNYFIKVPSGFGAGNYVWKLDLNNLSGFAYEIAANQLGVESPNDDGDNVAGLSVPLENNSLIPQYKQYLSYPADAGSPPSAVPTISNFRFEDNAGVDATISPRTTTNVQDSGLFKFTTDVNGTYSIIIDTSDGSGGEPDGIYGAGDVQLLGTANGDTEVVWDGKDNAGQPLPEGSYTVELQVRVGEYHFVATDAETSGGGTQNGLTLFQAFSNDSSADTQVFWDDITGLPGVSGGTTTLPEGASSSTPNGKHTWGNFTGSGFGDRKYIDTYVFGSSAESQTPAIIAESDSQYGDYGDALIDYDDTAGGGTIDSSDSPAVHSIDNSIYLGNVAPDSEFGPQNSTDANGDDDATSPNVDDEDAFTTLPNVPSVGNYSLDIPLNTAGDATLHGWIDFDGDGKFEEGEYQSASVTNTDDTASLSWSVPAGTIPGDSYARFRLTSDDTLTDDSSTSNLDERSVGSASDGEVEDYPVTIEVARIYDYGDAPDGSSGTSTGNYQTTDDDGGAAQVVINEAGKVLSLGSNIDADGGNLEDVDALADDNDGTPDDEDGVASFPTLTTAEGQEYIVSVTARNNVTEEVAGTQVGVPAYLVGFIDFNKDGDFADPGERSETVTISSGNSDPRTFDVTFTTPAGMTPGDTYARFRLGQVETTAQQAAGASAGADNGEVEDYQIAIADDGNRPLGLPFTCDSTFYITIGDNSNSTNPQFLYDVNRSGSSYDFVQRGLSTSEDNGYTNNFRYNALAYNPVDNYLYAIVQVDNTDDATDPYSVNNIVKIGSDGVLHSIGIPKDADGEPLPTTGYYAASILSDGTYIIGKGNRFAKIDLETSPPTILSTGTISGASFTDFAVDPTDPTSLSGAKVYGINESGSKDRLVILDVTGNKPTIVSQATNPTGKNHNAGSQFVDSFGTLYYRSNSDKKLYRVDSDPNSPNYGVATEITTAPSGGNHDGASCLFASAMQKEVQDLEKNLITTIPAGETVNYVYTISSGNVQDLTGVTFTDDLTSVSSGPPIEGTFTGNVTVDGVDVSSSADVSFDNDNQTIEISNLTIPAQTGGRPGEKLTITAEVKVSPSLATGDYYNQASISGLPSQYPPTIVSDYPPSATYEDPTPLSVTEALEPNLLLVKRITAINPGRSDEIQFNEFVNDDSNNDGNPNNDPDNDSSWPGDNNNPYLRGAVNIEPEVAVVEPGDEVEYTIYFLSNGDEDATNVKICDLIPNNMTFVSNSIALSVLFN